MNCLYYDEDKERCTLSASDYNEKDCPVKEHPRMCIFWKHDILKGQILVEILKHCSRNECLKCSLGYTRNHFDNNCRKFAMEMAADELERLTREKE